MTTQTFRDVVELRTSMRRRTVSSGARADATRVTLRSPAERRRRLLASLQLGLAAGIVAFWATYLVVGPSRLAGGVEPRVFLAFESAFPIADGLLAAALGASAWGHIRRRRFASSLSLAAAGALVFLGLVDASFNLTQGAFTAGFAQAVADGCINAACIAGGLATASLATGLEPSDLRSRAGPEKTWTRSEDRSRMSSGGAP